MMNSSGVYELYFSPLIEQDPSTMNTVLNTFKLGFAVLFLQFGISYMIDLRKLSWKQGRVHGNLSRVRVGWSMYDAMQAGVATPK